MPADRHARTDQRDRADRIEPVLAAEPTENMEATEATEPIDRTDPAEPMDRIEPAEPMDRIDPLDPMLSSDPAEPAERGELPVFAMLRFSHLWPAGGMTGCRHGLVSFSPGPQAGAGHASARRGPAPRSWPR